MIFGSFFSKDMICDSFSPLILSVAIMLVSPHDKTQQTNLQFSHL